MSILNIALGGCVFAMLVVRSGSLWLGIGFHASWNWCQGYVYGEPVSGLNSGASLLQRTHFDDSPWSGGAFGPEATLQLGVILVLGLVVLAFLRPRSPV